MKTLPQSHLAMPRRFGGVRRGSRRKGGATMLAVQFCCDDPNPAEPRGSVIKDLSLGALDVHLEDVDRSKPVVVHQALQRRGLDRTGRRWPNLNRPFAAVA